MPSCIASWSTCSGSGSGSQRYVDSPWFKKDFSRKDDFQDENAFAFGHIDWLIVWGTCFKMFQLI